MKNGSVYRLAYAGVLIAMNIVLSRFVSIPLGPTLRVSISSVPIILCGLWMGPFIGGASGGIADLLGTAISGYAPNPLITLSAVLMGVIPALFRHFIGRPNQASASSFLSENRGNAGHPGSAGHPGNSASGVLSFLRVLAVLAFTMLLTSQGSTTLGLSLMYGLPFWPTWISRLPQTCLLLIVNSLLVDILYSRVHLPLTAGTSTVRGSRKRV